VRKRKRNLRDDLELRAQLLQCVVDVDGRPCESVSGWVVRAIRPAQGGKRTDLALFGICDAHHGAWESIMLDAGYVSGLCATWEATGIIWDDLEAQGYLSYATS